MHPITRYTRYTQYYTSTDHVENGTVSRESSGTTLQPTATDRRLCARLSRIQRGARGYLGRCGCRGVHAITIFVSVRSSSGMSGVASAAGAATAGDSHSHEEPVKGPRRTGSCPVRGAR